MRDFSPLLRRTPARRPKGQALRQTEGSAVLHEPRVLSLRNESTAQPGGPATPTPIAGTQRNSAHQSDEESKALLEHRYYTSGIGNRRTIRDVRK